MTGFTPDPHEAPAGSAPAYQAPPPPQPQYAPPVYAPPAQPGHGQRGVAAGSAATAHAYAPVPAYPQPVQPYSYGTSGQLGYAPPAPTRRPLRTILIAVVAAAVVGGGIAGFLVYRSNHKQLSQATICERVKIGASAEIQATLGGTVTVTPGGLPVSGIPVPPSGKRAVCSIDMTIEGQTVPVYLSLYKASTDLASYTTTLEAHGFTSAHTGGSATNTTLVDGSNKHLVLVLTVNGYSAVEEMSIPSAGSS
jgi:hypothetical protein